MRSFKRHQRDQNARFLRALARTGNARLAARELDVHRGTYFKRRARCPAFAAEWDAALAAANAALALPPSPSGEGSGVGESDHKAPAAATLTRARTPSGRLQLRRPVPGRITPADQQAFLAAVASSANIRLAAAAAGFTHSAFYQRARKSRGFAREMRLALELGYARVEAALIAAGLPESHAHDAWRCNDLPPIPPMTPDQALQLLSLHQKTVCFGWGLPHRRKRRGEPWETYTLRLAAMWTAEKAREAEDAAVRRAMTSKARAPNHPVLPLPALDQVTGWSKADPAKAPHNDRRAMFGGWRIGDWKKGGAKP